MANKKRVTNAPTWMESRRMWRLRVQKNGKRRAFYSSTEGKRGKIECIEKAEAWLNELDEADKPPDPAVSEVFADWQKEIEITTGTSRQKIVSFYGRLYILPVIGDLRMSELKNEQQLQEIINNAYVHPARGKTLSRKTLIELRSTIGEFLRFARKTGLTTLHMENVTIPHNAQRRGRRTLQPDELRILFSVDTVEVRGKSVPEWFIYAFRFMTLTSLRPGELRGLKWSDIDGKTVHISRSINGYNETTAGKNANARRTFVLPELAVEILRNQRTMLEEAGIQSEYVFPDRKGGSAAQDALRRHLKHYCESCGIVPVSPYELRHTWFSINKALPRELVKMMGGHSESMDTFGVYGHELDGEREKMASLLDGVLQALLHPADGT